MSESEASAFHSEVRAFEDFAKVRNSFFSRPLTLLSNHVSRVRFVHIPQWTLCLREGHYHKYIPQTSWPKNYGGYLKPKKGEKEGDAQRHMARTFIFPVQVCLQLNICCFRLDPVQITQMAKHLETVYVSGWQCSSTASSSMEPGPDLAGE